MSIFTMEQVTVVGTMQFQEAVVFIEKIIDEDTHAKPVTKARCKNQILRNKKSCTQLMMSMSNWILAHPENGMKVIR